MRKFVVVHAPSLFRIGLELFLARLVWSDPRALPFEVMGSDDRVVVLWVFVRSFSWDGLDNVAWSFSGYVFPGWGRDLPPSARFRLDRIDEVRGTIDSETRSGSLIVSPPSGAKLKDGVAEAAEPPLFN